MTTITFLICFLALLSLFASVNSHPIRGSRNMNDEDYYMSSQRRRLAMEMGVMDAISENSLAPSTYESTVPTESPAPSGGPTVTSSALPSDAPSEPPSEEGSAISTSETALDVADTEVSTLEPTKKPKGEPKDPDFQRLDDYDIEEP